MAERCLMKTNIDILDQYALSLQGTASKLIERSIRASDFPSAQVAAGALGPRVRRASVQMEAMGLWRPSLDPIRLHYDGWFRAWWITINLIFTILDSACMYIYIVVGSWCIRFLITGFAHGIASLNGALPLSSS